MKRPCDLLSVIFLLALAVFSGCGGSNRQLQSLTVSPASTTAQGGQAQFTATGQFNAMPMSAPAAVSWWQSPPVIDPPSSMIGLTLTNQPFTAQCFGFPSGTAITVTAIAPMATNTSNPTIPLGPFVDLVIQHVTTQEGGFVAATAQMNCP